MKQIYQSELSHRFLTRIPSSIQILFFQSIYLKSESTILSPNVF